MSDAPDVGAAEEPGPSGTLAVLRQRDFGVYFVGNSLSNVGTWFQNLAAAILVYRLTRSAFLVGLVNFAQFIGAFLLAAPAGVAADRFDRRRLLIATQTVAAVVTGGLAVLVLLDLASAPLVIAAAFLLGLALAFMVPALLALVPLLVAPRDLDTAVGLNSLTFNLARAVGPVLAAAVIARADLGTAFAINAASFLVFIAALLVIRPRPQERTTGPRPRLLDTLRMVWADRRLRALLLAVVAVSTTTDPVNTLTPVFATEVLGRPDTTTGLLVGAFGAGATLTALTLTGWLRQQPRVLVVAMVVEGVGMLVFAAARTLPLALLGMAIAGAGFLAAITRATARIQTEVADGQLGRVMALWSLAFIGTRPLAALVDGAVAERFGAPAAAALLAVPAIVGAVAVGRELAGARAEAAAIDPSRS
ncbi:MAG: MFS transporter [Actinomycetes bacterium]